jgi:anti-sigma-K factor RskA
MSNELTQEQVIELLSLFVLGTLGPDEMMAVDTYLQEQPELQGRLDELEETAAQLAYAAPQAKLPPTTKQKLMNRAQAQQSSATSVPTSTLPRPSILDWLFNRDKWAWATAVSFACLLILAFYSLQLRVAVQDLRQTIAQLQADNETLQAINGRLREERLRDDTVFARFSTAERIIPLPGTEEAPEATGVFLVNGLEGFFVLRNLAALPSDQAYQLWLVPPGGGPPDAVSLGLLPDLDSAGFAEQAVSIPLDLQDFAIVDVSIEPASGSEHLSGPVVIRARVQ